MRFFETLNKNVGQDELYKDKADALGLNEVQTDVASLPPKGNIETKGLLSPRNIVGGLTRPTESIANLIGDFESKQEPEFLQKVMGWWSDSFTEASKLAAEKRKNIRNSKFKGQTIDAVGAQALGTFDEGERAIKIAREFAKANNLSDKYEDTLRHILMGGLMAPEKSFKQALKSLDFEDLGKQVSTSIMNRRKSKPKNKIDLIAKFNNLFAREGRLEKEGEPLNESSIDIENNVFGRMLREKLRREGHTDPEHFEEAARMAVYGMANEEVNEYSFVDVRGYNNSLKDRFSPVLSITPE